MVVSIMVMVLIMITILNPDQKKTKVSSSKKFVKEITDEELNAAVNCLRLEQQYMHLSPEKCL